MTCIEFNEFPLKNKTEMNEPKGMKKEWKKNTKARKNFNVLCCIVNFATLISHVLQISQRPDASQNNRPYIRMNTYGRDLWF